MTDGCFVILVERCVMQLTPAFFDQASIAKTSKIFKYLFQEPWRNEETITDLTLYYAKRVEDAKSLWSKKSIEFQNAYRIPDGNDWIKRQNDKKFNEVKRAKADYERSLKCQTMLEEFKRKRT